nr:ribonuclease H-like domain-containing protein [Tanacetum cinerariifolium]
YKSGEGYHAVPPPYTGTFMPPKPDLVFNDAPNASKTVPNVVNVESSSTKPSKDLSKTLRPNAPIVEDWTSDSEDEYEIVSDCDFYEKQMVQKPVWNHAMRVNRYNSARMTHSYSNRNVIPTSVLTWSGLVSLNTARVVTTAILQPTVKSPRPVQHVVNKAHSPIRRPINHRPAPKNSNFNQKVIIVKVKKTLKKSMDDMLHLVGIVKVELKFNLFSVSQMCDKKSSVLLTYTECVVLSSDFKLPDKNHVLLRVPRENNMYNVDLNNIVPSRYLTCLFAKATLDESTLWHRRLGHINFKTMNKLIKENENEVHVSPSGSDKTKKHDDKAKRADKGKSPIDLSTRVRDLRDEFEEFSINSTNRVNAASAPVTAAGPNLINNTNSFNTASPSDTVVSPHIRIARKSSFVDPSNYPDDPDMPALEDIVYSDYEEDVGAEADLSNLETNISVSPILTTRVHKDHLVTQIIGDLTSAPQTRSMARMVKEQGGPNQINDEDFHTCMFACFLSQEEPKKVH